MGADRRRHALAIDGDLREVHPPVADLRAESLVPTSDQDVMGVLQGAVWIAFLHQQQLRHDSINSSPLGIVDEDVASVDILGEGSPYLEELYTLSAVQVGVADHSAGRRVRVDRPDGFCDTIFEVSANLELIADEDEYPLGFAEYREAVAECVAHVQRIGEVQVRAI